MIVFMWKLLISVIMFKVFGLMRYQCRDSFENNMFSLMLSAICAQTIINIHTRQYIYMWQPHTPSNTHTTTHWQQILFFIILNDWDEQLFLGLKLKWWEYKDVNQVGTHQCASASLVYSVQLILRSDTLCDFSCRD